MWVGRAGNNIHLVPRIHQAFTEIAQVYPLATAIGLAAITQQCDTQRLDRLGGGCWVGRSLGLGLSLNCI